MNPSPHSPNDGSNTHLEPTHVATMRQRVWFGATLGWWLIGLATAVMVLLWLGGDSLQWALRYDRRPIFEGEWWRLITAHWVHGSFRHMALNVLGAWVIAALFVRTYSVPQWLGVLVLSTLAIDVGFLIFEPQLNWYVGASGVLHGALAAGAVAWWRTEGRLMASALTLIVVGKLTWEQLQGALPLVGSMPVIVDAHLYGAIGGALMALPLEAHRTWRGRQSAAPL